MKPKKEPNAPKGKVSSSPKAKGGGLLQKLANAKESVKMKFAVAAGRPDGLDTSTNDALVAGAEFQSSELLTAYRAVVKACKGTVDRQDAVVRAGGAVEQQWKICLELELQNPVPVVMAVDLERAASQLRARESEFDAQLMNGCVNSLLLSLDDYCQHRQADLKNSRGRYDHALNDYGIAVRKAQVRLGKGPDTMNAAKYLKSATKREIALQNYERVTTDHLAIHRRIEDGKNLEVFMMFFRSHEAQLKYVVMISDDLEATRPVLERSLHWAREEKEKQISAAREAAAHELVEEEKRYVELHDDFVRLFASNIMLNALFRAGGDNSYPQGPEVLVANCLDSWGLSETVLLEMLSRHSQDESLPLFTGSRSSEMLITGYIVPHFSNFFTICWRPLIDSVVNNNARYTVTKPEGMSAILTLLEEAFERVEGFVASSSFSPLFARLCGQMQSLGVVASFVAGRVIKTCLVHPEKFGYAKLPEQIRTSLDVCSFVIWEVIRGRMFVPMDAARSAQLKLSVTVTHYVSENVHMLNSWAATSGPAAFKDLFVRMSKVSNAPPLPSTYGSIQEKCLAIKQGGAVNLLLNFCRIRSDSIMTVLFENADRQMFYRFCDAHSKAMSASMLADRGAGDSSSAIEEEGGSAGGYEYEYRYVYADDPNAVAGSGAAVEVVEITASDDPSDEAPQPPPKPRAQRLPELPEVPQAGALRVRRSAGTIEPPDFADRPPSPGRKPPPSPSFSARAERSGLQGAPQVMPPSSTNTSPSLDDSFEAPKTVAPPRPLVRGVSSNNVHPVSPRSAPPSSNPVSITTGSSASIPQLHASDDSASPLPSPVPSPMTAQRRPPPPSSKPSKVPAQQQTTWAAAVPQPVPQQPVANAVTGDEDTPPLPPRRPHAVKKNV